MAVKFFYFLFLLTMIGVMIVLMKMGSVWAEYFFSFGIPFSHAYDYYRRHVERKSVWDLVCVASAKIGLLAGLLGVLVFSLYDYFFSYHKDEDFIMIFFLLGFTFFAYMGIFMAFCASLFKEKIYHTEGQKV